MHVLRARVKPNDSRALFDSLHYEVFVGGHFNCFVGHFCGNVLRNDDHAVIVAHEDIAGENWNVTKADREVKIQSFLQRQIGRAEAGPFAETVFRCVLPSRYILAIC
nr:hypothetical protein RTCK_04028 [Rhizobium sp. TCK]